MASSCSSWMLRFSRIPAKNSDWSVPMGGQDNAIPDGGRRGNSPRGRGLSLALADLHRIGGPRCLENPRAKGGILTNGERSLSISR